MDVANSEITQKHHLVLPPSNHRWPTTCLLVEREQAVVCGDQHGSLYAYNLISEVLAYLVYWVLSAGL